MTSADRLYARDISNRPVIALSVAVVSAAVIAAAAISSGLWFVLAVAVAVLAIGVVAFCTTTSYLEVRPGEVVRSTRLKQEKHPAGELTFLVQGTPPVFVIAYAENARKVVCTFRDDDADEVADALTRAGLTRVELESSPAGPEAAS